jgi:hypothetical protein
LYEGQLHGLFRLDEGQSQEVESGGSVLIKFPSKYTVQFVWGGGVDRRSPTPTRRLARSQIHGRHFLWSAHEIEPRPEFLRLTMGPALSLATTDFLYIFKHVQWIIDQVIDRCV